MLSKQTIKKLLWVALYSSPVVSALLITPVYVFNNQGLDSYFFALALMSGLVLFMWCTNILLTYILSKRKGQKNGSLKYWLSYLIGVVFNLIAIQWMFHSFIGGNSYSYHKFFHFHLFIFISINTATLILLGLVLEKERNTAMAIENTNLRMKNIEAANQQLKQQVQPHFLFNSLSTLKALIKQSPENAEEYLVKLSDFLRYAISSGGLNKALVADELKLCVDYLEMQKIRFGAALKFNISVPAEVKEQDYVPVLCLQMLAENAIKHNTFTTGKPLSIDVSYGNGFITVSNNLQKNSLEENTSGIGLANLGERYKMLSGETILINETAESFSVSVKVLEA